MLYGGPAHIKIVAEWEPEVKARIFGVVADEVPEPHQSVIELQRIYQRPLTASLDDCLKIYTQEETVGTDLQVRPGGCDNVVLAAAKP